MKRCVGALLAGAAMLVEAELPLPPAITPGQASRVNLLYIAVDDLRTEISGVFGQRDMHTPNLVRLQEMGVSFLRAYTQVTICSPSRTSFLTGMRPDRTRLWRIGPYFRTTTDTANTIVTLPQALKTAGFNTTGAGKIWHPGTSSGGDKRWGNGDVGGDDMPFSWSYSPQPGVDPRVQYWECDNWGNGTAQSAASAKLPGGNGCVTSVTCLQCLKKHNATNVVSWQAASCDDDCFADPMIAKYATEEVFPSAASPTAAFPMAFFNGFKRPHLSFTVPEWALDMYPISPPAAKHQLPPLNFPPIAWTGNNEIVGYHDVSANVNKSAPFPNMINSDEHPRIRRGYYAAVTTMDSALGTLLDSLEATGLDQNTWVVFHADHGYHLGDHGNFAKTTLFEACTRVPLIIVPPKGPAGAGYRRNVTVGPEEAFVELIDVFPTVLDVLNIQPSEVGIQTGQLGGRSLKSLLQANTDRDPATTWNASFTQIERENSNTQEGPAMGLSMRIKGWRYSEWRKFNYANVSAPSTAGPDWSGDPLGTELYQYNEQEDNDFDALELENLAGNPAYQAQQELMQAQLRSRWANPK